MDMEGIITRMGEIRVSCIRNQMPEQAETCTEVTGILYALLEEGALDIETAKDIAHDYKVLAKQYQAMYKRFGIADRTVHKDGVWHCPSCNRRVKPGHSFCHSCGKKLNWR